MWFPHCSVHPEIKEMMYRKEDETGKKRGRKRGQNVGILDIMLVSGLLINWDFRQGVVLNNKCHVISQSINPRQ